MDPVSKNTDDISSGNLREEFPTDAAMGNLVPLLILRDVWATMADVDPLEQPKRLRHFFDNPGSAKR